MCTVTFIPGKETIYFTSNRDEQQMRSAAAVPAVHELSSGKVIYPKDGAGGTWIAAHENGNVVIFLNGAEQPHVPRPPYRKSRGLILLNLIDHVTPLNCFLAINLNNIEPFTAVVRDNGHVFECQWNGTQKNYQEIDISRPQLWASVTLYDKAMIEKRKEWFDRFMLHEPFPEQQEIMHFHQTGGEGNAHHDLVINRNGKMLTHSITSISITHSLLNVAYHDLQSNERFTQQVRFNSSMAGKI